MRWAAAGVSLLTLICGTIHAEASKVKVVATAADHPSDDAIGLNEIPGFVQYSLKTTNKDEMQQFLELLLKKQFNSEIDGNFLVTLAVSLPGADKPLAERTLMSGVRKSKQFLFFTTSQTDTGISDTLGTMLDGVSVTEQNNQLKISLRTYYSDKITFDTATMQSILKLNDASQVAQFLAIPALVTAGASAVTDFAAKVLTNAKSEDLTTSMQLQFIRRPGVAPLPNRIKFQLQAFEDENDDAPAVTLAIDVQTITMRSRIGNYDTKRETDGARKGFSAWAQPTKFLESATFPPGKDQVKLFDLMESSGPKPIATALTMLRGYIGTCFID
jgi:hypothetical protein